MVKVVSPKIPSSEIMRFNDKFNVCKLVINFNVLSIMVVFSFKFNPTSLGDRKINSSFEIDEFLAKFKNVKFLVQLISKKKKELLFQEKKKKKN